MTKLAGQRSDYTFKYNAKLGRHGWLRLTPAYSVKLVQEIVAETPKDAFILDPFSGTATTGLCAAEMGMNAHLCDINPFLIWFGNTKLFDFSGNKLNNLEEIFNQILKKFPTKIEKDNWTPNLHNIERWWCGHTLPIVAALRTQIVEEVGEPSENPYSNLIWISFCRLIIETSSAAFNHVSMSFKGGVTKFEVHQVQEIFNSIFENILASARKTIRGKAKVNKIDSRNVEQINNIRYAHVITSPPYPNRMSYIRELRPYMYWTKFLDKASEAGELDWKAIGGTWGIATSRLKDWSPTDIDLPEILLQSCEKILHSGDKNSELMARYVHKYFYDMYLHFSSLPLLLENGARLDYIVGNSTFYGIHVASEKIYEKSLEMLGYTNITSTIVRKRNSKKELYEYCVSASWKRQRNLKTPTYNKP
ncbi:DNA adenine methylase [Candidatus Venteria ishoeyi]|uniref:DNA adenine methylase n=1 Tax=Candidatus Venteria ishoeyi TaxID=1899563 RepID=UPI0025A4E0C5|nr:DNA adenine methylase [Candidatus Venteria ishoeyi]MDM8545709.1 DNA adenine methylase [Candidatus Venteria ishoeyi]